MNEYGGIAIASSVAALISRLMTHPFDTLRARLQIDGDTSRRDGGGGGSGRNDTSNRKDRNRGKMTMKKEFVDLWRNEGVKGFYRGFPVTAVFVIPAQSTFVSMYEISKKMFTSRLNNNNNNNTSSNNNNDVIHLTSGFVAEIFSSLFWTPMEVIKQRQQVMKNYCDASYLNISKDIYNTSGIKGFFKGYSLSLATFGPFSGLYFMIYEEMKNTSKSYLKVEREDNLPISSFLISGFISASIAAAATCPLDVIKTRYQVQPASSIRSIISDIILYEGYSAFFKGLTARILWIAPGTSITMGIYDSLKSNFHHLNSN